jgi:hypothetical protein
MCYSHFISLQPLIDTEKNRVRVVQLPVIWAKSHVIASKQYGSAIQPRFRVY